MNAIDTALHRGERRIFPLSSRATEMADAMRMIVNRDGNVTEQSLIGEGFTAAEIVELHHEARTEALRLLNREGRAFDRVPEIIEKSIIACAWIMPLTAGTAETETLRLSWRNYCTSIGALKLDPWVSQRERCLVRLKIFLGGLSLIEREQNSVISGVAPALMRRVRES